MKIGKRLILTFALVVIISSIAGIVGLMQMTNMDANYSSALTNYGFAQGDVGRLSAEFNNSRSILRGIIIASDKETMQTNRDSLDTSGTAIDTYLAAVQKTLVNSTETNYYNTIKENLALYKDLRTRVVALALQDKDAEANTLLTTEGAPILKALTTSINALFDEKTKIGNQLSSSLSSQASTSELMIIIVILVSVILSIIIALIIARSISKPVKEMADAAQRMAKGDLGIQINVNSKDEIGQLGTAFAESAASIKAYIVDITEHLAEVEHGNLDVASKMEYIGDYKDLSKAYQGILTSLNETIGQISQSADQVSSGSEQVSDGAQALAQGATEQASSIEELSATISEISTNVKDNATNAADASKKVNQVSAELNENNKQMQEMIVAMSKISDSSNQIGKIIKTIEDIAFQTNILALNAAVEAARAGEAGKGFAVVADEVRNLASKSADAAKETTTLIQNSIQEVEVGTKIADATANALLQVVKHAEAVATAVNHISQTSNEQANSINQVTLGVEQISSVVQTNSATAEESAAASEELSGQAQVMKTLVGKFKLRNQANQNQNIQSKPQQENSD